MNKISTHGHTRKGKKTRCYKSWEKMKSRCYNKNNKRYFRYGGRGIKVCQHWHDFNNFLQDMGEPPPKTTLDRIDNDGNYEPNNCRWATHKEQSKNKSTNHFIEINGESKTITEWGYISKFSSNAIRMRIKRGLSPQEAIFGDWQKKGPPQKLSDKEKNFIIENINQFSQRQLAKIFGVSQGTIANTLKNKKIR